MINLKILEVMMLIVIVINQFVEFQIFVDIRFKLSPVSPLFVCLVENERKEIRRK